MTQVNTSIVHNMLTQPQSVADERGESTYWKSREMDIQTLTGSILSSQAVKMARDFSPPVATLSITKILINVKTIHRH